MAFVKDSCKNIFAIKKLTSDNTLVTYVH